MHAGRIILFLLGIGLSFFIARHAPLPVLWLTVGWGGSVMVRAGRATRWRRIVLANLASCLVILAVAEGLCAIVLRAQNREADKFRYEGSYVGGYYWNHEILGYAGVKDAVLSARKVYGTQVLYEINYSIGEHGFRVSHTNSPAVTSTVFFAGDSFMHGEGVGDNETIPFQVGLMTEQRHRIFNFSFHGYGPHQLFRGLDSGLFSYIAGTNPSLVVYGLLTEHGMRSAGLARWDRKGPWYEIGPDGHPTLQGTFEDQERSPEGLHRKRLDWLARHSSLVRMLWPERAKTTAAHLDLVIGLLKESQAWVEARGGRFVVLFWDSYPNRLNDEMARTLEAAAIPVIKVGDLIPAMREHPDAYFITHDLHPNPMAHRAVAGELVKRLGL